MKGVCWISYDSETNTYSMTTLWSGKIIFKDSLVEQLVVSSSFLSILFSVI